MILRLGGREVGPGHPPFIIAEAGVNHENSIETAELMIREAAAAGADAIKFQTYKADKLASAGAPAYWGESQSQREIFRRYDHFVQEEYQHLAKRCAQEGILFMSTPFDKTAVDMLAPLVSVFKVASADIDNVDLLRYIAGKRRPVLLSTGASTLTEIARAVDLLRSHGVEDIGLLHCILHYPTEPNEANLRAIGYLANAFPDCVVGYSDHTLPDPGMAIVTASVCLGASIVEKHFTLDKSKPGNDHYHAMDPADLRLFVENVRLIHAALGSRERYVLPGELAARQFARRSVVADRPIKAGEVVRAEALTTKRPGTGIPAADFDYVVGRIAKTDIAPDTILEWKMLY